MDKFDYWKRKNGLKMVDKLTVHEEKLCGLQKVILNPGDRFDPKWEDIFNLRDKFYPEMFYYEVMVLSVNSIQVYRTKIVDDITARLNSPIEVIL